MAEALQPPAAQKALRLLGLGNFQSPFKATGSVATQRQGVPISWAQDYPTTHLHPHSWIRRVSLYRSDPGQGSRGTKPPKVGVCSPAGDRQALCPLPSRASWRGRGVSRPALCAACVAMVPLRPVQASFWACSQDTPSQPQALPAPAKAPSSQGLLTGLEPFATPALGYP